MLDSNADLHTIGCKCFVRCNGARVAFADAVWDEFFGLEDRQKDRFKRIMELWCEGKALTPEMMNRNEGRSSTGIRIEAFKAFKVRLYGFDVNFNKIRTFLL